MSLSWFRASIFVFESLGKGLHVSLASFADAQCEKE